MQTPDIRTKDMSSHTKHLQPLPSFQVLQKWSWIQWRDPHFTLQFLSNCKWIMTASGIVSKRNPGHLTLRRVVWTGTGYLYGHHILQITCPQAFKILDIMPGRKQGMPMTVSIVLSSPFSPLPQLRTVCGHQSKRNGPPWGLVILITGFRASPWNTWSRSEECFHSPFPISLCWEKSLSLYFTPFSHLKMKRLGWKWPCGWPSSSQRSFSCIIHLPQLDENKSSSRIFCFRSSCMYFISSPPRAHKVCWLGLAVFPTYW